MSITPEGYIQRLLDASTKKVGLLLRMLELTKQQALTITEDGIDRLADAVAEKQIKINEINKIDEEFDVYFQGLKRELKITNLDEIKNLRIKGIGELQEQIRKISEIAKEIFEKEHENNDKAQGLLNDFKVEIKKLNQGKMVNSAYNVRPIQNSSNFIDKKK